jgi:hypothetical protein
MMKIHDVIKFHCAYVEKPQLQRATEHATNFRWIT